MENAITKEIIETLIAAVQGDEGALESIEDSLGRFERYHSAVYELETWLMLHDAQNTPREVYQSRREELDRARSSAHNALPASVNMLNRLAHLCGLPPVYAGDVSETQPAPHQVADAALAYVSEVIAARG
jgi:hypothetical protein